MDTFYKCRSPRCRHLLTIKEGELTTANVKTHCNLIMEVDTLPGKEVVITREDFADEEYEAIHGTVQAPSPAWIDQYIVAMQDGKTRYLYRRDFQVIE